MKTKKLTFFESLMLVAGAGVGTGILTIPYAVNKIGIFGTLISLLAAYGASAIMYLMIADLTRNSKKPFDLIGILDEHLFNKRGKKLLTVTFFVLLVLLLLENLVVYVICASDVLNSFFDIDGVLAKVIFYLIATAVFMFGIKGIGLGEKFSVILIGIAVTVLTFLACFDIKGAINVAFGEPSTVFAVYGLFMFAFSAIFSIIQVCNHIDRPELTGKAVIGGLSLNAVITLVFAFAVILGSDTVTEVATIGLSESIDLPFIKPLCSVLVLLAMFSSFWSSGLAFADVVGEQFGINKRLAWVIATVPALVIACLLPLTVLEYVQIGAGALSLILVAVVIPAFRNAIKAPAKPLLLGRIAKSRALSLAVSAFIVLMAVSSFIPIE